MSYLFLIFRKYILVNKFLFFILASSQIFMIGTFLIFPYIIAYYIDNALVAHNKDIIQNIVIWLLFCSILNKTSTYLFTIFSTKLQSISYITLNLDIITHIQRLPLKYFYNVDTTYLNKRINDDSEEIIAFLINNALRLFIDFTTIICISIILSHTSQIADLVFISICICEILLYLFFKKYIYMRI